MRKINARTSFGVCLLPFGFLTFEISLQYSRKPVRCQRTTVSGETTHAQFVFALVRSARPSVPSPWERRSRELGSSPAAHRPEAARSSAQPQPPPPNGSAPDQNSNRNRYEDPKPTSPRLTESSVS